MELKGKKALFLGDSITEGVGASKPENAFWQVLGRNTGLEVKGYGVGGTRIARQTQKSGNPRWDLDFNLRAAEMDKEADIICVFGGTNDYGHGFAPIGTENDTSVYTFLGAVNTLFTYLQSTYPDAFIFVMTPLHRLRENNLRGDGYKPQGLPLSGYVDLIRKAAERFSLPVLDLYRDSGINPNIDAIRQKYLPDGLHPSDLGHAKLAKMIEAFLRCR